MPAKKSTTTPARNPAQKKVPIVRATVDFPRRTEASAAFMQIPDGLVVRIGDGRAGGGEAIMVPMAGRRGYILITSQGSRRAPLASESVVDAVLFRRHHWEPSAIFRGITVVELMAKLPKWRGPAPRDSECEIGLTDTIIDALRKALDVVHERQRLNMSAPQGAHAYDAHIFRAALTAITHAHATTRIHSCAERLQIPGAERVDIGNGCEPLVIKTKTGRTIVISDPEGRTPILGDDFEVHIYPVGDDYWNNAVESFPAMSVEDLLARLPDWEAN